MTQTVALLKPLNLSEAQARLDALPGSYNNVFENHIWQFESQQGNLIRLDFNDMLGLEKSYTDWPLAHTVEWILLTKRIWLSLSASITPNVYILRLNGIKLLWAVLAHHHLTQLTRDRSAEILAFLLMHGWRKGAPSKNLAIKSYPHFSEQISLKAWKLAFAGLGLDWIARDVTESFVKKQLQELIPALTDETLTYRDWFQGGSYNLLTLDYGRYYVEHCLSFFEEQYPLAFALASTLQALPELASSLGYEQRTVSQALPLILQGRSAKDLQRQWVTSSITTLQNIHERVTLKFRSAYQQARFNSALMQDATLKDFVTHCGLQASSENIDRIRVIIWDWLNRKDKTETQHLLSECQPSVSWADFEMQLGGVKKYYDQQPCRIPTDEDYKAIGLSEREFRSTVSSYPRQLIHLVSKIGLTNVVALTGWRKSEFGFPYSAIKRTRNNDRLDQYAFPWRYQVDWYVDKTHGKVRQLRELTFSTMLISKRLQALVGTTNDQPCLYAVTEQNKNPSNSGAKVDRAVRVPWGHFVSHYFRFMQLDDWTTWQALQRALDTCKSLTELEQQELNRLSTLRTSEEWADLSIDANLKEAWRRAREEWPRLDIFLTRSNSKAKNNWLVRYRDGSLRSDWHILLEAHLTNKTKDWIHSLSDEELTSNVVSRTITNQLKTETLYPSPHAFRHMWAEAVYRRFDGDAGWMIRSQFKHISRSMWLAYIRDKDNRFGHQRAKEQVISSLVHNYLSRKGEGYAGQLHTWLRRLVKKTSVLSPTEQEQLAERLATVEIENIKANPWGYCLLKRRTRNNAKCAEMGEPMRHNASPELCLGCTHNLMQRENVEWSLFHATSHVEALQNPVVPAIFKASSYDLVKFVARHVRTLNPQHEALPELNSVMECYKASSAT